MKKIGWIVVVGVIIILMGLWWYFRYSLTGIIVPFGSSSCGKVFEEGFKDAVNRNDPNFCLGFNGELNQFRSLKGHWNCASPQIGAMKWAHAISKSEFKAECLIALSEATSNISICDLLDSKGDKFKCIVGIADSTNNSDLCKQVVEDEFYFRSCVLYGTNFPSAEEANNYVEGLKSQI